MELGSAWGWGSARASAGVLASVTAALSAQCLAQATAGGWVAVMGLAKAAETGEDGRELAGSPCRG